MAGEQQEVTKKIIRVRFSVTIGLVLFSFLLIFVVHRDAFSSSLRHGMVEDGSVSQFAGEFLSDASLATKYKSLMDTDGALNGRYRPGYYLYETLPFFLTVVKNGDYKFGMSGAMIQQRINGDLRLHIVYLLSSIAVAAALLSIVVHRLTGSIVYAVFVPYAVVFSKTLVRNMTYNDTAEPPQLLGMCAYIFLFLLGERLISGEKSRLGLYSLVTLPVLAFTYLAKETSVVLFLALLLYAALRCLDVNVRRSTQRICYLGVHVAFNAIMFLWVLVNVKMIKSAYSSNYEVPHAKDLLAKLIAYLKILNTSPFSLVIPSLGFAILIVLVIRKWRSKCPGLPVALRMLAVVCILLSLSVAFLLVNLPWEWVLERYMLPAAFFGICASMVVLGYIDSLLKIRGRQSVRWIMGVALVLWSLPGAAREYERVSLKYDCEYGANSVVDRLVENISAESSKNKDLVVLLDVSAESSWMWIQVARILDREHQLNVVLAPRVRSQERLYLREHDAAGRVTIHPSDGDGLDGRIYDVVYSSLPFSGRSRERKLERQKQLCPAYAVDQSFECAVDKGEAHFQVVKYSPVQTYKGSN